MCWTAGVYGIGGGGRDGRILTSGVRWPEGGAGDVPWTRCPFVSYCCLG